MSAEITNATSVPVSPQISRGRRRLRRFMITTFVIGLIVGPFLFYRVTSLFNRVQIVRTDVPCDDNAPFDGTLKIVAYNIAHGRGTATSNWEQGARPKVARVVEIGQFLKRLQADVVVLNEVDFSATWSGHFDQAATLAREAGFPWYVRQTNFDFGFLVGRWQFGNVVMSKYPIIRAVPVELPSIRKWESWLAGQKRGVLCTLELPDGNRIDVMGVHFEPRGEAIRVKTARFLGEYIRTRDLPLVVAGDLNTTPSEALGAQFTGDGENAFDLLIAETGLRFQPQTLPGPRELTFPSDAPRTTIDWVLFSPDSFQPLHQSVIPTQLSDHLPVVSTIKTGHFQGSSR